MKPQMYVDLDDGNKIVSRDVVLRKFGGHKKAGEPLTTDDLTSGNATLLSEVATGDVPTGLAIYNPDFE